MFIFAGYFTPSGVEVIINSEIWDLTTFKLLHTCQLFDQSRLAFGENNIIYSGTFTSDRYTNNSQCVSTTARAKILITLPLSIQLTQQIILLLPLLL